MSSGDISSVSSASTIGGEAMDTISGSGGECEENYEDEGDEEEQLGEEDEEALASSVGEEDEDASGEADDAVPSCAESGSVIEIESSSESDQGPRGFLAAARAGHAVQPAGGSSQPAGIRVDNAAHPNATSPVSQTITAPPPVTTEDATTNTTDAVSAATLDTNVAAAVAAMSASAQARVPAPQLRALHDQHGEFVAEQTDALLRLLGRPLASVDAAGAVQVTSTSTLSSVLEPVSQELVAAVEALRSAVSASLQRAEGAATDQWRPESAPTKAVDDSVAKFFAGVAGAFTDAAGKFDAGPVRAAAKPQTSDRYVSFLEARCSALSSDLAKQRVRAEQAEASNLKMRNAKRFEQRLPAASSATGDGASLLRSDERSAAEARHMTTVIAGLRSQLAAALAEARGAKDRLGVLEAQHQSAAAQPRGVEHVRATVLPQCLEPVFGWSAAMDSDGTLRLSRRGHDDVDVKIAVSADSVSVVENSETPMPVRLARTVLADYDEPEAADGKRARDEGSDTLLHPAPPQPAPAEPTAALPALASVTSVREDSATVTAPAPPIETAATEGVASEKGDGTPEQLSTGEAADEPQNGDDEAAGSESDAQSSHGADDARSSHDGEVDGDGDGAEGESAGVFDSSSVFV